MATTDEIKNLALFTLGFPDEIDFSVLTDPTVLKVNRIYNSSLSFVLSNYAWRFSLKRVELTTRVDATDTNKYKYNYTLPDDFLAIQCPYYDSSYDSAIKEFEGDRVYLNTDATKVFLWYRSLIDDSDADDVFPEYFIDYFKYKLALDLCFNLTGDTDLIQLLLQKETAMFITAKNVDARQQEVRTIKASPFTAIRR
jgi:hypothetical protein